MIGRQDEEVSEMATAVCQLDGHKVIDGFCAACYDTACEERAYGPKPECDNCGYDGPERAANAYPGEDCPRCGGEIRG